MIIAKAHGTKSQKDKDIFPGKKKNELYGPVYPASKVKSFIATLIATLIALRAIEGIPHGNRRNLALGAQLDLTPVN
jgi:hypothetical protein